MLERAAGAAGPCRSGAPAGVCSELLGQVRFPHVPPNGAAPERAWVWESILPLEARFEAMAGALCPVLGPGTKEMRMCWALY